MEPELLERAIASATDLDVRGFLKAYQRTDIDEVARLAWRLAERSKDVEAYNPICSSSVNVKRNKRMTLKEMKQRCESAKGKFVDGKTEHKHLVCLLSVGSADCHACQLSINGAVTGATIKP